MALAQRMLAVVEEMQKVNQLQFKDKAVPVAEVLQDHQETTVMAVQQTLVAEVGV
jgi:hypothetical protein